MEILGLVPLINWKKISDEKFETFLKKHFQKLWLTWQHEFSQKLVNAEPTSKM